MPPKIYADFHKLDDENRMILTTVGTREDLARLGIELTEGMALTFYMDDADEHGNSDDIMVDGVAHYSAADKHWVAAVDWDAVYHASEAAFRASAN
jgi:hypothetical protein